MAQPRIIRYLENGVYKYATVKYVGDLEKLRTTAKSDIVSAINELFESGGAGTISPDLQEKLTELEEQITAQTGKNAEQDESLQSVKTEYELSQADIERLKKNEEEVMAEITAINQKAIDLKEKTDQVIIDLEGKVNSLDHQVQYEAITTELGDKVNSIDYQTQVDALNASIKSNKDSLDAHGGQITTIKSDLNTVEGEFTLQAQTLSTLDNKVSSHDSLIKANADAIVLKASQTSVDSLDGRIETAEGKIDVQAGQISQRVTKTEFDNAVGVDKWVASKYIVTGTDLAQTPPSFPLLREKHASEVKEIIDSIAPTVFTGTGVITHLFTNVYLQTAKTISLSVKYDDSIGVYVNGAKVYENKSNAQAVVPVSISLRAGWNTLDILHGLKDGTAVLNLGTTISTQVDKMTTVIGVGDKNETRLTQAESAIVQTEKSIQLKASQTDVTNLGNRVSDAEGSITILTDAITSKVSQTEFNAYSQRVSNAESTITQLSNEISQKVSQDDYDNLNQRVSSAESTITQHTTAIELKASQSSLDKVSGRLSTAEGQLSVATDQIATKVSKTEFDSLQIGGRNYALKSNEEKTTSAILEYELNRSKLEELIGKEITISFEAKANNDGIHYIDSYLRDNGSAVSTITPKPPFVLDGTYKKYSYTIVMPDTTSKEVLTIGVRGSSTTNSSNAGTFSVRNMKVEQGNRNTDWSPAPEDIDDNITQLDSRLKNAETSIIQTADSITQKAEKTEVYTKVDTDNLLKDKANQSSLDSLATRVNNSETLINQNSTEINLKANSADVYTKSQTNTELGKKANQTDLTKTNGNVDALTTRVVNAEAELVVQSDKINAKVEKTDHDKLAGRMSNAESQLDIQAEKIESRVTKSEFDQMSIGTRNIVINSDFSNGLNNWRNWQSTGGSRSLVDITDLSGIDTGFTFSSTENGQFGYAQDKVSVIQGDVYTLSAWVKVVSHNGSGKIMLQEGATLFSSTVYDASLLLDKWTRVAHTFTARSSSINVYVGQSTGQCTALMTGVKLERGSKASDWTPNPEDISRRVGIAESSISQQATEISSKVSKTDYTGSTIVSMINQTPEAVKITAKNIDLNGAVTFNSLDSSTKNKINSGVDAKIAVDELDIGARNIVLNTDHSRFVGGGKQWYNYTSNTADASVTQITLASGEKIDFLAVRSKNGVSANATFGYIQPANNAYRMQIIKGKKYTISFLVSVHGNANDLLNYFYLINDTSSNQRLILPQASSQELYGSFTSPFSLNVYKVSFTFTAEHTDSARLLIGSSSSKALTDSTYALIYVSRLKLEEGNKATAWSPANEDITSNLYEVKDLTDSWRVSGTTKINGGSIQTDSLSAISSNIGTVTAGTIKGVDIESAVFRTPDFSGYDGDKGIMILDKNGLAYEVTPKNETYGETIRKARYDSWGVSLTQEKINKTFRQLSLSGTGLQYSGLGDGVNGGFTLGLLDDSGTTVFSNEYNLSLEAGYGIQLLSKNGVYSNSTLSFPSNIYASQGGAINLNNSDVLGGNNFFMSDTAESAEGFHWKRSDTPSNDYNTSKWDTLRVKDGVGYLNDQPIFSSDDKILWTGASFPNGTTTITPKKKLSECANGWILVWSDYDADPGNLNDFHFVYTFVSKEQAKSWSGYGIYHTVPTSESLVEHKYLYIADNRIVGHDNNRYKMGQTTGGSNSDAVLRAVLEF